MGKLPVPEISELKKLHIFKRISDLELSQIREVMEKLCSSVGKLPACTSLRY